MSGYVFKTSDIEACSDYPNAVLYCSPDGCKISGTSEDIVMLYETSIIPMVTGNFEVCVKLDKWSLIEDHNVLEVTPESLIFDAEYYTKFEKSDILESRLPRNIYVARFPEKLENYSGKIEIFRNRDLLVKLVDEDITLKIPYVYSNSDEKFCVQIHSDFLRDYINGEFLKIYFETNFPVCVEDAPHRVYIAPCV